MAEEPPVPPTLFARTFAPTGPPEAGHPGTAPVGLPPVVLLHGMLSSHRYMEPIRRALCAAGFEVVALDLLGFGRSPWHARTFGTSAQLGAIAEAVAHLDRYVVVGHSLGALLGRELLRLDGACVGCISLATPAFSDLDTFLRLTWESSPMIWALVRSPRFITWPLCMGLCQQRWLWRPLATKLLAPVVQRRLHYGDQSSVVIEDFFDHSHYSCWSTMHQCLLPLLLAPLEPEALRDGRIIFVHGSDDTVVPFGGLQEKLRQAGFGPDDADVRVVEGASHFSIIESDEAIRRACMDMSSRAHGAGRRRESVRGKQDGLKRRKLGIRGSSERELSLLAGRADVGSLGN